MSNTEVEHVHTWEPVGIVTEVEHFASPVSHADDQERDVKIAVRSCKCGALRRTIVSYGPVRWAR